MKHFLSVREKTNALVEKLSADECMVQAENFVSPIKWHLAHTTWFFENFVLRPMGCKTFFSEEHNFLFNSYYKTLGQHIERPSRALMSKPSLDEIKTYRSHVNEFVVKVQKELTAPLQKILELGIEHEQQHQELILMDIKYNHFKHPFHLKYREKQKSPSGSSNEINSQWIDFKGAVVKMGASETNSFTYDNEHPQFETIIKPFSLHNRLVTNGEFLEFIADKGYQRPELWLSDGWDFVCKEKLTLPLYWLKDGEDLFEFTLAGIEKLDLETPVSHLSYFEADAFANWAKAELPTEFQLEHALNLASPTDGNFLEQDILQPHGKYNCSMFGNVWQWTQSAYLPYPGYTRARDPLGEYNGKFMCNQFVLKGGCALTPTNHIRTSYRNFYPPWARWQMAGLRLMRYL